uniref:Methylase of chemotaxis methyl-accepting protein n=1 Tax=Desulfovibrio sp. U5L TaxID=596152 RepID=I2Q5B0_9BACT
MSERELEEIELTLLLEAIFLRYGHDFRRYARSSVRRRVQRIRQLGKVGSVAELIPRVLRDPAFFDSILGEFSITVTDMFRDPGFFLALRERVVPYLKTYPSAKIWVAGCATGEPAYSTAIVLEEEGGYDRSTVFATDFNAVALGRAREGIYSLEKMRAYTANYQAAGGRRSFSDYYHARYGSAILNAPLKRNITFAEHNLATDGVFGEMHYISCRNVLIYFDRALQDRVLALFHDSLAHGGFLALGSKESLRFSGIEEKFEVVDRKWKIYRKKIVG